MPGDDQVGEQDLVEDLGDVAEVLRATLEGEPGTSPAVMAVHVVQLDGADLDTADAQVGQQVHQGASAMREHDLPGCGRYLGLIRRIPWSGSDLGLDRLCIMSAM